MSNTKKNKQKKNNTMKKKSVYLIDSKQSKRYKSMEEKFEKINYDTNQSAEEIELSISKKLKLMFSPKSIKPEDDYYTFINYQWIKGTEKNKLLETKFYEQYDDFRIVQEKVYYDIIDIIKNYIKKSHTPLAKQMENVLLSETSGNDNKIIQHIFKTIKKVDEFIAADDLYGLLAFNNRNELVNLSNPIRWKMMPNAYDPTKYANYLLMPILPIVDYSVYLDDPDDTLAKKQYKTLFKKKYNEYLNELFHAIYENKRDVEGLEDMDDQVYDIGKVILETMFSQSVPEKEPNNYNNVVKAKDALPLYGFDWDKFSKCIGYKETPDFFIVNSLSYLKTMMEVLTKCWKTKKWRIWWIYINVKQQIRFSHKLYPIYFNFYEKYIEGAKINLPKVISPIFILSLCFDSFITNEYIDKYKNEENATYTEKFANDLRLVFINILETNEWLSPKTKLYAIIKLEKMKMVMGVTKNPNKDPLLGYSRDDVWENIEKIYQWRKEKLIQLNKKQVIELPEVDWTKLKLNGRQCYIVNAYYTPSRNDMYIPLAYLQKPFIDLGERGIEYSLAYIGFTIAHELSHSLDATGRRYSYDGKLLNWWTDADLKYYDKIIKNVIEQYEVFASYDKLKFDVKLTIDEDLADISGLAICTRYLIDFQNKNDDIIPIKVLSLKALFTYFAIQMRQNIARRSYKYQFMTNPHPLDKYRVNVSLSRIKIFKDLYNVKKGDHMYWEHKGSEHIW